MGFMVGVLFVVSAAILAIYKYQVLLSVITGTKGGTRKSPDMNEADDARMLNRALDSAANERRIAEAAHRRVGPLLLESIRAVIAPTGATTVLAHNVGGVASNIAATSDHASVFVNPASVQPDDNVQLTILDADASVDEIAFTLSYTNAAGAPAEYTLRFDCDEMKLRAG